MQSYGGAGVWTTVNQAAVNKNVFRCFLKSESELQSRMLLLRCICVQPM